MTQQNIVITVMVTNSIQTANCRVHTWIERFKKIISKNNYSIIHLDHVTVVSQLSGQPSMEQQVH